MKASTGVHSPSFVISDKLANERVTRNTNVELECEVAGRSSKRLVKTMLVSSFCDILDCAWARRTRGQTRR